MSKTVPGKPFPLADDPYWYRRAVFYEVMVRAFSDSNADGIGDLRGLIDKLDYLEWLGVDALWLPPFYASPLKDGGYDVADYRKILPVFGTIDDFCELVDKAHARNLRVMIDLVLNHTSDQHEWFQQSRSDPEGPYGDYYVWSDTDQKWTDIRIIFSDTETSNWAFDPVRGQFYFHRFFSHQPDLNFRHPEVHRELFDIARYWLDMGVDGFRLDAVPYLYESDGGGGESEPETHEFIAAFRAMIDREYPGRVLLSEANQSTAETLKYFGTATAPECQMAFAFPVMPRIFYAFGAEDSTTLGAVLQETQNIPPGGTWATFLRNHDELSLEMVTDEERQAMYSWYAPEPRMRANVGIRRRLAPLLDNSLEKLKLAHALLLAIPGSPFLYYGDEIGMGDNIWLNDRDASRTPMQWTNTPNAGFSEAPAEKLYLPLVDSEGFGSAVVNVEAQRDNPDSLLHQVKSLLQWRKSLPALAEGSFELISHVNRSVLAFLRSGNNNENPAERGQDTVCCLFSFSATPSSVRLTLPMHLAGSTLVTLTAEGQPVTVGPEGQLEMQLPGWGFAWLSAA